MFEMRGIDKHFDAVVALKNARLTIAPGEIRALLGSNGSGKSTMIKILAGLVDPNSGEILIDGAPVVIRNGFESRQLGIATAFQDLSLIPTMSVRDNILLGREPLTKLGLVDRKTADAEIDALLKRFHLDVDPDAYVQTIMPSTQAMLEVAKAVALKPRLLLLDEVTAALHYDEIETLFGIMRELKAEGVAILYVTHRMHEIFEVCDTTTIMRSGETVLEGNVAELSLDDIIYHMTGRHASVDKVTESALDESDRNLLLRIEDLRVPPKVRRLSLEAYRGEIVGIGGLQGQGQPEFIRALLGAEEITGGTVHYDGKDVHFKSPSEAVNAGIGFISGERNREAMFPRRSIEENITAGRIAKGNVFAYLTPKSLRKFSNDAVEKYQIKIGNLSDTASTLSGGNQQKLVVARWIAMNPKLLILDDPTKGVDIHSRREIHAILRDCAANGMTVIISSSETEVLLDISDRTYVFYEATVSDELPGANKNADTLVAAMMGMRNSNERRVN